MTRASALVTRALTVVYKPKGEYPVERLFAFSEYSGSVAPWRVVAVLLRTWLPPLLLLVVFDLMPLRHPREGWKANAWLWVRSFAEAFLCSAGILVQINDFILEAPLTKPQMLGIMSCVGIGYTATLLLLANYWVFPIPFMMAISGLPFTVLLNGFLLLAIGVHDRPVLLRILKFTNIVGVQVSMLVVYPGYQAIFLALERKSQVVFMILLPVIKILYKRAVARVSVDLEDLRPAIMASVDLFDTLYKAKCMQAAGSLWLSLIAISLDIAQNYVTLSYLSRQFKPTHAAHEPTAAAHSTAGQEGDLLGQVLALFVKKKSIRASLFRLESCCRLDISVAAQAELDRLGRLRLGEQQQSFYGSRATGKMRALSLVAPVFAGVQPLSSSPTSLMISPTRVVPFTEDATRPASPTPELDLIQENSKLLQDALQLLYKSESLLLMEFIEALVPVFYVIYLAILFHLPNAKFYVDVGLFTPEKLRKVVVNILAFALLELLSLLYVVRVLRRRFGISGFYQLAFTLDSGWHIFQSNFNAWIVLIFQFSLMHSGTDFTFQFEWLNRPTQHTAP